MNYKVSVIVPVYNCEKFIDKCLDSILNQSYDNLEVVLVNDGSKDDSLLIINNRKKQDSRIIVVDKPNGGVSSARNVGLDNSTGDYIFFVDADDYIELDCIQKSMNYICKYNLDIFKFAFVKELTKKIKKKYVFSVETNMLISRNEYVEKLYPFIFSSNDFCNITNVILRKDVIGNNRFPLDILLGEDYLFFVNCLNCSKNIYFSDEVFYHYVVNGESATHFFYNDKNLKKLHDSIFVNLEVRNILLKENYDDYKSFILKCNNNIFSNFQVCLQNVDYTTFKDYVDQIFGDDFLNKSFQKLHQDFSLDVKKLLNKEKYFFFICKIKNIIKREIKKIMMFFK